MAWTQLHPTKEQVARRAKLVAELVSEFAKNQGTEYEKQLRHEVKMELGENCGDLVFDTAKNAFEAIRW